MTEHDAKKDAPKLLKAAMKRKPKSGHQSSHKGKTGHKRK